MGKIVKAAAVQASPVFMDKKGSVEKSDRSRAQQVGDIVRLLEKEKREDLL